MPAGNLIKAWFTKQQLALAIRAAAVGKRGIASPSPVPANFRCENNANGGLSD
jgi:hypothetical protein